MYNCFDCRTTLCNECIREFCSHAMRNSCERCDAGDLHSFVACEKYIPNFIEEKNLKVSMKRIVVMGLGKALLHKHNAHGTKKMVGLMQVTTKCYYSPDHREVEKHLLELVELGVVRKYVSEGVKKNAPGKYAGSRTYRNDWYGLTDDGWLNYSKLKAAGLL